MRHALTDKTLLMALLTVSLGLKLSWLGVNDLAGDEPFTVFWATRPLAAFPEMLRSENNPPLYFLLMKCWLGSGPFTDAWSRVPSAFFSALTVVPLFRTARAMSGTLAATIACLLFTLSNHQFGFAHEVRGYSLLLLLTATGLWLVVRGPGHDRRGARMRLLLLGAVFVAMVWTHFFGWLVIGLLGLCAFVLPEWRDQRVRIAGAAFIAMLSYLPYLVIFYHRAEASIAQGTWVAPHRAEEVWHMIRRWSNQPMVTILLLLPIAVVSVRGRLHEAGLRLGLIWWWVPLIALWLVQWWIPVYVDRYLLFASIGFYLTAGHALSVLGAGGVARWIVPATGVLAMAVTFEPWKGNDHHPARAAELIRLWRVDPHDPPILVRPFWYKPTLWVHLETPRPGPVPWSDPWSERYNDLGSTLDTASATTVLLVHMTNDEIPTERPLLDGFRVSEDVRIDDQMSVARCVR